ncbi:GntR family transcriptional regulator [Fictibacillus sp. KU28468]|uniref:GntR family transcriptional regulator n=1 Tax=Fictibacillus sp. KU28468 TaxID=2991053 RepID=UPI00223E2194|nr:GntR family transcriptional regulator [Fictibacillus sp. KU28468]UZJ77477.1 GntR family transcriptional regulator [Fictibacillus sp. KU28468]
MENNNRINKQQYAYKVIKSRILDGRYPPGYRIVIDQLARELQTSAIPVREAIRNLETDGLIHFKPYSGAVVTPFNEKEYLETLSVLAVLEGHATAISAQHFPRHKITDLIAINNLMKESLDDFDFLMFGNFNREFHSLTYQYCDNHFLVENIKSIWNRLDRVRKMGAATKPSRAKKSIEEHEKIIEMLFNRHSFSEIEAYVRTHKLNTVHSFLEEKKGGEELRNYP